MALFTRPLLVRLSYFPSLDYKPRSIPGTAVQFAKTDLQKAPAGRSKHGHSAVDVNRLSGDIGRFIRTEIYRRGGNILGLAKPCRRNFRQDGFALLVVER